MGSVGPGTQSEVLVNHRTSGVQTSCSLEVTSGTIAKMYEASNVYLICGFAAIGKPSPFPSRVSCLRVLITHPSQAAVFSASISPPCPECLALKPTNNTSTTQSPTAKVPSQLPCPRAPSSARLCHRSSQIATRVRLRYSSAVCCGSLVVSFSVLLRTLACYVRAESSLACVLVLRVLSCRFIRCVRVSE